MSAFTVAPFGKIAPHLEATGYAPVPIKPGYKAPMIGGWQDGRAVASWPSQCRTWGTGVLAATCPAIDVDVRDRELVRVLIALADDMIGPSPFRIGRRPRALMPFMAETPFPRLSSRWFAAPGEDWAAPGYEGHRIEVLASGQQWISYAIHPATRRPYRWARSEPMQTYRVDLPELTEALATEFVAVAEELMIEVGMLPLRGKVGMLQPDLGAPDPVEERPVYTASVDLHDAEALARQLDPKAARARGGWVCKCPAHRGVGHRSLSIGEGHDNRLLFYCFAGCAYDDIVRAVIESVP